jgi:hypothetical protein
MSLCRRSLIVYALAPLFAAIVSCASPLRTTENALPDWLDARIKQEQSQPVANPPASVWEYEYKGQTTYYIPSRCCDVYSELYDAKGTLLCNPDGGITGKGDGRCNDFMSERKREKLIWRDSRGSST